MDRSLSCIFFGVPAVRVGGTGSFQLLLHADSHRERRESSADAEDRRAVSSTPVFRISSDHGVVEGSGMDGQRKACATTDAIDGIAGSTSGATHQSSASTASGVSVSSAGFEHPSSERSLVCRHHVYPYETGVSVLGGRHGLVQSLRAGLGAFQLIGNDVLFGRSGTSTRQRAAGDLQHRPGGTVHQRGIHRAFGRCGDPDQHGWPGPGNRQHLHRTIVAEREIRRHLSARLHRRDRNSTGLGSVLPLLQYRTQTSGAGKSDACGCPRRQHGWNSGPSLMSKEASAPLLGLGVGWTQTVTSDTSQGLEFFRAFRETALDMSSRAKQPRPHRQRRPSAPGRFAPGDATAAPYEWGKRSRNEHQKRRWTNEQPLA